MFLFFSVARSATKPGQAERATEANSNNTQQRGNTATTADSGDGIPTGLLDVTPQALRMSSPFNAAYWLSAA